MRKPFVIAGAIALVVLIVYTAVLSSMFIAHRHVYAERQAILDQDAKKSMEPEVKLTKATTEKIRRKALELDKAGITGSERSRQILREANAAKKERDRVRKSDYQSPYNMAAE